MAELSSSLDGSESNATGDDSGEASVSTCQLERLKSKVTCPSCRELYSDTREPKLMPCLHVVCAPCLKQLASTAEAEQGTHELATAVSRKPQVIHCPQCQKPSCLPPGEYHTSLVTYELIDLCKLMERCKSESEVQCDHCAEARLAVEYCHTCGMFACDFCCQVHRRWGGYANHCTVPIGSLSRSMESLKLPKGSTREVLCAKHDMQLRLYCETCRELICHDCTVKSHDGHNFDLITDQNAETHKKRILDSFNKLSDLIQVLDEAAGSVVTQTESIRQRASTAKADIESSASQIQNSLDKRRDELIVQVDGFTREPSARLQEHSTCLESLREQIIHCKAFMSESLEHCGPIGMLSVEQTICRYIQEISEEVKLIPPLSEQLSIHFNCHKELTRASRYFGEVVCRRGSISTSEASLEEVVAPSQRRSSFRGHSWESLSSQVVHPFCQSVFMQNVHLYVNRDFDFSSCCLSDEIRSLHEVVESPQVTGSVLSVAAANSPRILGIPVRTIEGVTRPSGIALTNHIMVTEFGTHQVSVLDNQGKKVQSIGKKGERNGQFMYPHSIAVDREGKMLVTDCNYRVQLFSPQGRFCRSVGSKGNGELMFKDPTGVAIGSDCCLYMCERENHRIHVMNKDLSFRSIIGQRGSGPAEFNFPTGVTVDSEGNLYVADTWNHRIQVLTKDGTFIHHFGTKGSEPGQLNCPSHVCVDPGRFVYVSEIKNHRVSVFRCNGEFLMTFGHEGAGLGQLKEPRGLALDQNWVLYVSDFGNNRIHIFK